MAQTICCPCGSPIDCDNLELVITVECPRCRKELNLELQNETSPAGRRAMLTVMEGPYWVGEQFLLPVGEVLRIGQGTGNWLSLEGSSISDVHCRLQLTTQGSVVVEDQQSKSGTWFGEQRIARGRLIPRSSFKVGEFRFRLDLASADGTTITAVPSPKGGEKQVALPTMHKVQRRMTPMYWAFRNRFMLSRYLLLGFAWLGGVYHTLNLHFKELNPWPWHKAITVGVLITAIFSFAGRRVTLSHKHLKYLSLLFLVLCSILDLNLNLPGSAVAALFLAAALLILIMPSPSEFLALFGSVLGVAGGAIIAVCTYQTVIFALGR